jgi:hypothetical protein
MRPVFLLLAGFFGLMLVGFPALMYAAGLSMTAIVWVTLLIVAVTVGILGFTLYLARAYDQDESSLDTGDTWAEWTVPLHEYRRFVAEERRGTRRKALAYALGGTALGLLLASLDDDSLTGIVIVVVFLLAAIVILTMGGPPRDADREDARVVRIGPRGVRVMGRYLAFDAPLTRLRGVAVEPGDQPTLCFRVKAGRRTDDLRVPVAPGHLDAAKTLVERLREEYDLAT